MPALTFPEARQAVLNRVTSLASTEVIALEDALDRVLAEPVQADRDYPPLPKSVRDGFAIHSGDVPGIVRIIGETRAGDQPHAGIGSGEAIEIMTGAPIPPGADAVVMVEHVTVREGTVQIDRPSAPGDFINDVGSECRAGDAVLPPGRRIGYAEIALLGQFGATRVRVHQPPEVAIIATGDEIVEISAVPAPHQIRNSNAWSLAAQVRRAGGLPRILPIAHDTLADTLARIEEGLESDLLLLSGGVSAGKYDVVEKALAAVGAEFYFDRVLIQPGQPVVFGRARERFFFGLPGNPTSTMVCFEVFARAALEILAGVREPALLLLESSLTRDFHPKPGLTRFLPALLSLDGASVTPIRWTGSADVAAMARSNAFLVTDPDQTVYRSGDRIRVMLR